MKSSTLRIGRLAGIPVGVHPLWLVIVGLITLSLGHDYYPSADPSLSAGAAYALGLVSALALFAGVLLHELGHALVARRYGVEVEEIDLWLLGGVARMTGEAKAPGDELRFALAGPAVTAGVLAVFGALRLAAGAAAPEWLRAFLDYQVYVNAAILVFNLIPAFPLDGGRAMRALLWRRSGDRDGATARAAQIGRAFGFGLVVLGGASFLGGAVGGLWLALIGGFLIVAGRAEEQSARVRHSFEGRDVASLMSAPAVVLGEDLTLEEAVTAGFAHHLFTAFPVVDAGERVVGVLTLTDVRAVAAGDRRRRRAGDVARRDPALLVEPATPVTELLERPAFLRTGRAVVVDADGRALGVVSVTDADRRLRADALLGGDGAERLAA